MSAGTFDQQSVTNRGPKARRGGNTVCMYALFAVHLVALVVCIFFNPPPPKESLIINKFFFISPQAQPSITPDFLCSRTKVAIG